MGVLCTGEARSRGQRQGKKFIAIEMQEVLVRWAEGMGLYTRPGSTDFLLYIIVKSQRKF